MKLFVVVFCIALMVNGLGAAKATKEDKEDLKALKRARSIQAEINVINQRLEMMQKTIEHTWTLDPYIPVDDVNEIKALAAEEHKHQDGFQTILDEVVAKIDEVQAVQEAIESDLKESYASHRSERGDEESILTAIQDAVNNADLQNKNLNEFNLLHKKLISIHHEFKRYERYVKDAEANFLDRMFPNIKECYFSIQSGICELSEKAIKVVADSKTLKPKEIEKISTAAKKKILDKLDDGLEWKEKDIALSQMKDLNEKQYRKHYDIVKKKLDNIVKYLNPGATGAEESEE